MQTWVCRKLSSGFTVILATTEESSVSIKVKTIFLLLKNLFSLYSLVRAPVNKTVP